jgi:hypothetical protein
MQGTTQAYIELEQVLNISIHVSYTGHDECTKEVPSDKINTWKIEMSNAQNVERKTTK